MPQSIMEVDVMEKKRDKLMGLNDAPGAVVRKCCFLFGGPINKNRKAKITAAGKVFDVFFDSRGKPKVVRK